MTQKTPRERLKAVLAKRSPGRITARTPLDNVILVAEDGTVVAEYDFQYADDADAHAAAINCADAFIAVADAADRNHPGCERPVHDSEGDGEWSVPVTRDCGECDACVLTAALEDLDTAIKEALKCRLARPPSSPR